MGREVLVSILKPLVKPRGLDKHKELYTRLLEGLKPEDIRILQIECSSYTDKKLLRIIERGLVKKGFLEEKAKDLVEKNTQTINYIGSHGLYQHFDGEPQFNIIHLCGIRDSIDYEVLEEIMRGVRMILDNGGHVVAQYIQKRHPYRGPFSEAPFSYVRKRNSTRMFKEVMGEIDFKNFGCFNFQHDYLLVAQKN